MVNSGEPEAEMLTFVDIPVAVSQWSTHHGLRVFAEPRNLALAERAGKMP
jgi:hypothetical protein